MHARLLLCCAAAATQRLDGHVEAAWRARQPHGRACVFVRVGAKEGDHQREGVRAPQLPAAAGAQGAAAAAGGVGPCLLRLRLQAGVEVRQGLPSGCQDGVQAQEVACRQICIRRADVAEVPAGRGCAAAVRYPLLLTWRSGALQPACRFRSSTIGRKGSCEALGPARGASQVRVGSIPCVTCGAATMRPGVAPIVCLYHKTMSRAILGGCWCLW